MNYRWVFWKLSLLSSRSSDGTKILMEGYWTRQTLYTVVLSGFVNKTHKDQEVQCHRNMTFYKQVVCRLWHLTVELWTVLKILMPSDEEQKRWIFLSLSKSSGNHGQQVDTRIKQSLAILACISVFLCFGICEFGINRQRETYFILSYFNLRVKIPIEMYFQKCSFLKPCIYWSQLGQPCLLQSLPDYFFSQACSSKNS